MLAYQKRITAGAAIIYILAATSAFAIALAVGSEPRTARFWGALAWTEALIFIVGAVKFWTLYFSFAEGSTSKALVALLPSLWVVVILYAAASFMALMIYVHLAEWAFIQNWHIAVQIVLFSGAAVVGYAVYIIFEIELRHQAGGDHRAAVTDSPLRLEDLKNLVIVLLARPNTPAEIKSELERLKTLLSYSVPAIHKLAVAPTAIQAIANAWLVLSVGDLSQAGVTGVSEASERISVEFRKLK